MWLVVVGLLMLVACKPDVVQDTERPIIGSVTVNGISQETHQLAPADDMVVQVQVTDNTALGQLKVNIHSADDGHGHVDLPGFVGLVNTGIWTYSKVFDLSGTSAAPSTTLVVPDTISGVWHLEVMAIDKAGNESEEKVYNLVVLP